MASGSATLNKIERAHQMYREGKYAEALDYYTDSLSAAKTKPQKIALHSNRAACYLKLHDFNKAAEECTSVLELDHNHTGALMLRAQTLVTLKKYHSALFDVNLLIELNPSSEVYRNLQARLKAQLPRNIRAPKKHLINSPQGGRQFQNRRDTPILTTRDGTELKMSLVKKTPTMMTMKSVLNLSSDFVLKPLV
ncbi:hypothetical protein DH2020_008781 [Rehmannia glutinosa]|uniref:Uncharacterized protein n=1 Tax=Rehmannia glutinosa TaxID=99300 RepID=A0ABR0X5D5_REHGL